METTNTTTHDNINDPTTKVGKYILSKIGELMSDFKDRKRFSVFYDAYVEFNKGNYSDDILNVFINGLRTDILASRANKPVSECGKFAPRRNSTKNKQKVEFVDKIRLALFPPKTDSLDDLKKSHTSYQKCLSTLTKKFLEQEKEKIITNTKFKLSRLSEHRELWCSLQSRPLTTAVTEPTAMPVEIAKEDEMMPFLEFLKTNTPTDANLVNKFPNSKWIPQEKCIEFKKGAFYTDGRMDLCKQGVGPKWIGGLMESLQDNEHMKHFLLGNNIIGTNGAMAIHKFLQNHKSHVGTWYLAGNDINSEGIAYLVDGLENDPDLRELWLKRNPLKSDGMVHIKRLLEKNNNIVTLDLHNVAMMDDGLKMVLEGLKQNTSLRHLYLEANGLTEKGMEYLVEYFDFLVQNNRYGIDSLWVGMNRVGDNGISKLVQSLSKYQHMKRLCVGSNMLTHVGAEAIYHAFKNHPNLVVLDVGMYKSTADMGEITNRISDAGAKFMAQLLVENKTIQYLSVTNNDISNDGLTMIGEALKQNSSLLYLDFKQYFIDMSQGVYFDIKNKLKENRKNNNISEDNEHLRYLKHTNDIVNIDSIYRNSGKTGKTCSIKMRKMKTCALTH